MHAGGIAALTAAGGFVLLVLLLAYPLIKLGRALDEASIAIRATHQATAPLLAQAQTALGSVNSQLGEVEDITRDVTTITSNVASLTAVVAATVTTPLIKIAALTYGVRSAVQRRQADKGAHENDLSRRALSGDRRVLGRLR